MCLRDSPVQLRGNGDGPGEPVGKEGHQQDQDRGDRRAFFAQNAAQHLVAPQGADRHDKPGYGGHVSHLSDDDRAGDADQRAQKGVDHACRHIFPSFFCSTRTAPFQKIYLYILWGLLALIKQTLRPHDDVLRHFDQLLSGQGAGDPIEIVQGVGPD